MATLAIVWLISTLQIFQSALGSAIDRNRTKSLEENEVRNLNNSTKAYLPLCSEGKKA
jgi:hypothetical protein